MRLIRVLLAVPPTLRNVLIPTSSDATGIQVRTASVDALEILLATGELQADVVVVEMRGGEVPGIASHLLAEYPYVKVLAVAGDASHAVIYELHPRLVPLKEIPPGALLAVIRTVMNSGAVE